MTASYPIALGGCRPVPLASYLKALAVLRLVALQVDSQARGAWRDGQFILWTSLDREALLRFLLDDYVPTPVLSPWNGGSGFHPKDNQTALLAIEASSLLRLAPYRMAIGAARSALRELEQSDKPWKETKPRLLGRCRATFPEEALPWLDAAAVLAQDGPAFMPLLGTGGNDGRLDFSNNFMQQLLLCLGLERRAARRQQNLGQALFGAASGEVAYSSASLGQFLPGGAGGTNAGTGFEGGSVVNPWDYVLALEGGVCFAGATSRRLSAASRGKAAFPFTVDSSAVGGANLALADASGARAEVWLPLWERPTTWAELEYLLGEGRVQWGRHQARNAVDFAQAAVNLGVDRGITAFQRTGLLLRNGRSYLAVALDRVQVRTFPGGDLLKAPKLVRWIEEFARLSNAKKAPQAWASDLRRLEAAIYAVCLQTAAAPDGGDSHRLQEVLLALAGAERVVAGVKAAQRAHLQPLDSLNPRWLEQCTDGTVEWRLAAAVAMLQARGPVGPLRVHLEPVQLAGTNTHGLPRWQWDDKSKSVTWSAAVPVCENFARLLSRRCLQAEAARLESLPLASSHPASLEDVYQFLAGEVDDRRLAELVQALALVAIPAATRRPPGQNQTPPDLPRLYAVLKLLFWPGPVTGDITLLPNPAILPRLAASDLDGAGQAALRQLRGHRLATLLPPNHRGWLLPEAAAHRLAAALLIPVEDRGLLRRWVLQSRPAPERKERRPDDSSPVA